MTDTSAKLLDEYIAAYMEDVDDPSIAVAVAVSESTTVTETESQVTTVDTVVAAVAVVAAEVDDDDSADSGSSIPKWVEQAHDETGEAIIAVRNRLHRLLADSANETQTRKVITAMLEGLGYDPDIEVRDEFRLEGRHGRNRPDYAVFIGEEVKFCVEAKAIRYPLNDANREQLKDYVEGLYGCEWGVLTNGRVWELYYVPGAADDALQVSSLDLLDGDWNLEESISELVYLHRHNVKRGKWEEIRAIRELLSPAALQDALLSEDVLKKLYAQFWPGSRIRSGSQRLQELRAAVAGLF